MGTVIWGILMACKVVSAPQVLPLSGYLSASGRNHLEGSLYFLDLGVAFTALSHSPDHRGSYTFYTSEYVQNFRLQALGWDTS